MTPHWLMITVLVIYVILSVLMAAKLASCVIHADSAIEMNHVRFDMEDAREDER
mgnify:CR=1 FL=1